MAFLRRGIIPFSILAGCVLLTRPADILAEDRPAGIPAEYSRLYQQTFSSDTALRDFAFPDPTAWRIVPQESFSFLEQFRPAKYQPPVRSPVNYGLIAKQTFGNFVMDVECQQTSREYGHRDMVFVLGYQSPSRYYYAHIASKADDHANQIFLVNDAPRKKISTMSNSGNNWGKDRWKTVRIRRDLQSGEIAVYFHDLSKPVMTATDRTFAAGRVGFGTFDDTCRIRSVQIWGESAKPTDPPVFHQSK